MPKVITRIFGGLGNQLFCYAAARRLAIVNNFDLVIDDVSGFAYDKKYQRHCQLDHFNISCRRATSAERMEPFSHFRRRFMRVINQRRRFDQRNYITQEGMEFFPSLISFEPKTDVYLEGYWQSEQYFNDIETDIRQELTIIPPGDIRNIALASDINSKVSVAVHVRFFDEANDLRKVNSPVDYYTRAIAAMENLVPNAHYFIFSDRPDAARARIPLKDDRITLVSHNRGDVTAYADLWLMTQCQHFIIANSTFSWWGAWLCNNKQKKVIAPAFKIIDGEGCWGFDGLLPTSWIKI